MRFSEGNSGNYGAASNNFMGFKPEQFNERYRKQIEAQCYPKVGIDPIDPETGSVHPAFVGVPSGTVTGTPELCEHGIIKKCCARCVILPMLDRKPIKPLLNKTEIRARDILRAKQYSPIWEQAFTLRLSPPFRSYTPDLAYMNGTYLTFVECKGPHRFREKGIAKAALAAKTYPAFRFELWDWKGDRFKITVLSS